MDGGDWTRRRFAKTAALGATLPTVVGACSGGEPEPVDEARSGSATTFERVEWDGYPSSLVIDALASPGPFNVRDRMGRPLTPEMIDNARRSGITAVNVTVSGSGETEQAFQATVRALGYFDREVAEHPDVLMKVRSVSDLRVAKDGGRLGLIMGFQDTVMLGSDLSRLDLFKTFGVRIIQLTYNLRNRVGDGCLQPENGGLTAFGREVVSHMNDLGILVDLGHVGVQTTADAIGASRTPVAITHSGCRAVYDHPRSKRDEELRAMADRGGVIGIYMMPFLNAEGPAQPEHLYRHVEHALQVCGEDHVGIGSDLSITPTVADQAYLDELRAFADERQRLGIGAPREHEVLFIPDLNHPERMGMIADGLLARGHSESVVEKVIGGNWARLFEEVWT